MKKPALVFAIKCSVILFFAACTSLNKLAVSKSISEQLVNKPTWKVNCFSNASIDKTCIFEDYTFSFDATGKVVASKGKEVIEGHWLEDNISNTITISFNNSNTVLDHLNDFWNINTVSDAGISFEKTGEKDTERFLITSL
ncbi:hypothetical protein [Ferruginibacter sp.]